MCVAVCIHDCSSSLKRAQKHLCTEFSITLLQFAFSLSVFSLSFFTQQVFLPMDRSTFMQPDTGSCFIHDMYPHPNPLLFPGNPLNLFLCVHTLSLSSASLWKNTQLLNLVWFWQHVSWCMSEDEWNVESYTEGMERWMDDTPGGWMPAMRPVAVCRMDSLVSTTQCSLARVFTHTHTHFFLTHLSLSLLQTHSHTLG